MQQIRIMKFGGSSVADASRISNVAAIVAEHHTQPLVVVVSAMQGVTDLLIAALDAAYQDDAAVLAARLGDISDKHRAAIAALQLKAAQTKDVTAGVQTLADALSAELDQIKKAHDYSKQAYDSVVSYGERTSVLLLAAALEAKSVKAQPVEASKLIVTNDRFGDAEPLLEASSLQSQRVLLPLLEKGIVPVVTGFIGATAHGAITTLGRGGSDYTSTILGYCLNADDVIIWTDVTGVMTADPRVISEAQTISELSYEEASELSFYGAKVLHPLTMLPASHKNIPIFIKNSFEPKAEGTRIRSHRVHTAGAVKAISTLNGLSMITVRGSATGNTTFTLSMIVDALLQRNIDILVLQQSSSDHSIMLMVRSYVAETAVECIKAIRGGAASEAGHTAVHSEDEVSLVAVVGNGLHTVPGLVGDMFSALALSGVDVVAITHGASKHNLTFAIKTADAHNAVRSLHQAFQLVAEETRKDY